MFSYPKQDFLASIVVFLVALPLCMGIAIASGAPVATGLITGIVGGLIVGVFSGAPLQVSGPAAGLTVIVYQIIQDHGLESLGITVLVAGLLQLVAGLLKYGRWFRAVSPAVVYGMLAGIGVLIFASQTHVMVDDSPKGSGLDNLISIPGALAKGLPVPEIHSYEQRTAERAFLQSYGNIHEQQVQLRELAAEKIPHSVSDAAEDSSEPEPTPPNFDAIADEQAALKLEFEKLTAELEKTKVVSSAANPNALQKSIDQAPEILNAAEAALRAGDTKKITETQIAAQRNMEQVLSLMMNHDWAAKIGLLTIVLLVAWNAIPIKKIRLVPAPLFAIVLVTLLTTIYKIPVLYVEVPENLWSEVHFPSWVVIGSTPWTVFLGSGIVLAVVASAETLLCATAVDQMQSHTRTAYNQELVGQGVGNIVCGFLGALPMTGVIVRSSANVNAGARTRLSTILHGVWLLTFVAFLSFVLRLIPTAALAAILVYTGYKLVNVKAIKNLRKYGWGEVAIYFATLGTIVCTDLLTGVITGIVLAAMKLLHSFAHLETKLEVNGDAKTARLTLEGAATFIRLPVLAAELERVPPDCELHVDFEQLHQIDHACLDLLMNWAKQHEGTGGSLVIDWESLQTDIMQGSKHAKTVATT
ncbi:MAG: SulP family inorganic anion transporter [Planctomycetota bacterium]|nr:SulP family inorganic anion transporter [Planctomycetota bacterium]